MFSTKPLGFYLGVLLLQEPTPNYTFVPVTNKITPMTEKFTGYTTGQLQARLDKILPVILLLTDVWNNPTLTANIISAWQITPTTDQDDSIAKVLEIQIDQDDPAFDDFLLFIHNYCTKLCAEKLVLQFLIGQKNSDIVTP